MKTDKKSRQKNVKGYSTIPKNVNMAFYKQFLTSKLKDTLEIAGFTASMEYMVWKHYA
jgi:hypothetical protein